MKLIFLSRNFFQTIRHNEDRKKNLYDVFVHFKLHDFGQICHAVWFLCGFLLSAFNDLSPIH